MKTLFEPVRLATQGEFDGDQTLCRRSDQAPYCRPARKTRLLRIVEQLDDGSTLVGRWIQRPVVIRAGNALLVRSEPSDYGMVEVTLPVSVTGARDQARWALGAMAYSVFDRVARASVAGQAWARAALPPGRRPGGARPKTLAERQRAFRVARRAAA